MKSYILKRKLARDTDVLARAYNEIGRDFDMLQRALAYLWEHHKISRPTVDDIVWAADYIGDYDQRMKEAAVNDVALGAAAYMAA